MKKAVFLVIAIVFIAGLSVVWYIEVTSNQQSPSTGSPTPAATKTPSPAAIVTANLSVKSSLQLNGSLPNSGDTLIINGTITNNSTNTAYNVGLKVYDEALILGRYRTVIDVTIPIESGKYNTDTNYTLTTLAANQTIAINAVIYPDYGSQEPNLQGAYVTVVWSNMT